jgi:hypothetical protein
VVETVDENHMLEETATVDIAAPPAAVHAVAEALDWLGSGISVTRLSQEDGVGGTYELRMHVFGAEQVAVLAVDAAQLPGRLGFSSVDCRECTIDGEYVIETSAIGCTVRLRVRAQPHGRYRFFKPLIPPLMQRSLHETLGRLKLHVEQQFAQAA